MFVYQNERTLEGISEPYHKIRVVIPRATVNMFVCHVKPVQDHPRRELPWKMHIDVFEKLKRTRITMQNPFKAIPDQRKVWELSRKIDIEEVEEPEATRMTTQSCPQPSIRPSQNTEEHENYHKKCTSKSRRSWKTGNTTRIAKPNPDPTTAANPKARELPRKMKSKHESTRITVRNLRCNPAFFP